jgi:transcriptional regulator with XRE-family HTH domain
MTFDTSTPSHTFTEKQFADALGLSVELVRQLRRQGRIPHIRVNRRVLYLKTDVPLFLDQHRQAVSEVAAWV